LPPYNSATDFVPVVLAVEQPLVLIVRKEYVGAEIAKWTAIMKASGVAPQQIHAPNERATAEEAGMDVSVRAIMATMLAVVGLAAGGSLSSHAYPDRPIRLIVSFPAGGSSDATARIVQPGLEKLLGQPLLIENRPGAGGMIAIDAVAKAAPDGHVIGLGGAGALGTNLGLQQKMSYDPQKDIAPVTGLASSPFILAAPASSKGKTLRDFIAMAKGSDRGLAVGHGSNGTLMHLTAEMLNQMAGTRIGLVPYRGMAPVMNDLLGGHVALGIVDPPSARTAIDAGTIATVAITSATRFAQLPDIPTFAESGLPGFESTGWFGIVVSSGAPADVIAKLNAAFVTVLNDPAVVKQIRALGSEPMPMTPAAFSAFIGTEIDKWMTVVTRAEQKPN
jgi:tripartite-type tricarboxylate transporter receptor subunit TctC